MVVLSMLFVGWNFEIVATNTDNNSNTTMNQSYAPRGRSNGGFNWSSIEVISEPVPSQNFNIGDSDWPDVAVDGNKIYVVWHDNNNTNGAGTDYDIFFQYFDGNIWSDIQVISEPVPGQDFNTGDSAVPRIAVENGKIYVVWNDYNNTNGASTDLDIFYRCNITGISWEPVQVISEPVVGSNTNTGSSYFPKIAVENGKIYVGWYDNAAMDGSGTDFDIYYICNLTGCSWEDIQVISEPIAGQNFNTALTTAPSIAVENGKIYMVWNDFNNTNGAGTDRDIFYRCNLTGSNWEDVQVISEPVFGQNINTAWSQFPAIAVENGKIFVVWYDANNTNGAGGDDDIFYRANLTSSSWEDVQVISEPVPGQDFNTGASKDPAIAVENGKIHIVWEDQNNTNGAGTDEDVFYKCNLTGSDWETVQVISEPVVGSNYNTGGSFIRPKVAVENGNIYVVWDDTDNTNGAGEDRDIFFRSLLHTNLGPKVVYSVKAYSDVTYTNEITMAELGDTVYVELLGLDENANYVNWSVVNISSTTSSPSGFWLYLLETDENTGAFRGSFRISDLTHPGLRSIKAIIGENITISSVTDTTKNATVLVSTAVQLRPLQDKSIAIEDTNYFMHYWSFGYNQVSTWLFYTNASWLNWDDVNHDIYGTPDNGDVGTFWVKLNITDGLGHYDEHYFNITVNNTPPNITNQDILIALEDKLYSIDYNSTDDGQGTITWHLETNASWLGIDPPSGVLSGTPTNNDKGNYWVNVSVDDGNDGWDWSYFEIIVIDTNDPPIILTENVTIAYEDELYWVEYHAIDIDGEHIFEWILNSNATWLSLEKDTGVLSGTPTNADVGIYYVNITVMDMRDGQSYQNFTLEVINVNDAPKWLDVPEDTSINEGELFYFDVNATDVDLGDVLKFNLSSHPVIIIIIDSVTGLIEWRASIDSLMEYQYTIEVILSVTDGRVTIWSYFKITVIMNPRPTTKLISPTNNSRVSILGTELKWTGYDDKNETLTYVLYISKDRSAVSNLLVSHRVINNTNLTSYSADDLDVGGIYYWTVVPFDGFKHGGCSDDYFVFEINRPPTISLIPPQKATVGTKFKYELKGQDPNIDDLINLNYSLEIAPEGMTIDHSTGVLTWTPTEAQLGNHNVTVSVSDGIDQVNITFEIAIAAKAKRTQSNYVFVITGVGILIILASIGSFIGGTEVGKYKFLSLIFVPLYNRLHPNKIFDNYTRGQIHGYIRAKPGDHYNSIKYALNLKNGTLTHHTKVLEKEGFISIRRDGLFTRFYPAGTRTHELEMPNLIQTQEEILDIIRHQPGITQHEINNYIRVSQPSISYNLTFLKRNNLIKVEQHGRENRYYINHDTVNSYQNQDQIQSSYQSQNIGSGHDQETYMSTDSEYELKKI